MATAIRRISVQNLKPGMTVANAIMPDGRSLLVAEKTCLTQSLIDRIILSGVLFADVLVSAEAGEAAPSSPFDRKLFETKARLSHTVKDSFTRMRMTKALPHEEFIDVANEIATTMIDTPGVFHSLQWLRSVDNYTYTHSVNVGVLAGIIGKWTGYQNLQGLILAGLLHDVGKTQIPLEILNKPSALTPAERSVMQSHSTLGYELALDNGHLTEDVVSGILFHHERLDGTGYPSALHGGQVPYVAKILAVADVFDAMTSNRVYRSALTPLDVLEELYAEMFSKLDPGICFVVRQRLKELLVGSEVILSDGRPARIVLLDGGDHFKPVLQDEGGKAFSLEELNLHIAKFA